MLPRDPTLCDNYLVNEATERIKKEKLITDKIADRLKTPDPLEHCTSTLLRKSTGQETQVVSCKFSQLSPSKYIKIH